MTHLLSIRQSIAKRRRTVIGVTISLAVGGVAVFAAASFSRTAPAVTGQPRGMRVSDDAVTLAEGVPQWNVLKFGKAVTAQVHWTDPVTARVRIDERRAARIGSPLSGRVTGVFVELGQHVKKGNPLFSVMSTDIAALRSEASKAAADLDVARVQYTRVHEMVQAQLLPGKDELAAGAQRRQAELSLTGIQARIGALRVAARRDNEFVVSAPRDGVVVEKNLLPAQEVSTDGTLMQIADVSDVWVVADVFESDAVGLEAGTSTRITVPSLPGFSAEVRVDSVSSVVDPTRHSVLVKARLPNAAGKLRPNEYADMRFRIQLPASAVEIAASALVSDGAAQSVYVEESPGHFVRRKIVAGPARDGKVVISEGLRCGERIVEEGGILLDNQIEISH